MKHFILLTLILIPLLLNAQVFDGVKADGNISDCILKFKQKGYFLISNNKGIANMKGRVGDYEIELFIVYTHITKKVAKFVVYLPKRTSWVDLREDFAYMSFLQQKKFGEPTKSLIDFLDPYYEGDGYELQAVKQKKVRYILLWLDKDNANYGVEISEFLQVRVSYENNSAMELFENEKQYVEKKSF